MYLKKRNALGPFQTRAGVHAELALNCLHRRISHGLTLICLTRADCRRISKKHPDSRQRVSDTTESRAMRPLLAFSSDITPTHLEPEDTHIHTLSHSRNPNWCMSSKGSQVSDRTNCISLSRLYSELVTGSRKYKVASRERNKVATYAQKGGESAPLKPTMTTIKAAAK